MLKFDFKIGSNNLPDIAQLKVFVSTYLKHINNYSITEAKGGECIIIEIKDHLLGEENHIANTFIGSGLKIADFQKHESICLYIGKQGEDCDAEMQNFYINNPVVWLLSKGLLKPSLLLPIVMGCISRKEMIQINQDSLSNAEIGMLVLWFMENKQAQDFTRVRCIINNTPLSPPSILKYSIIANESIVPSIDEYINDEQSVIFLEKGNPKSPSVFFKSNASENIDYLKLCLMSYDDQGLYLIEGMNEMPDELKRFILKDAKDNGHAVLALDSLERYEFIKGIRS